MRDPSVVSFVGGSAIAKAMRKREVAAGSGRYLLDDSPSGPRIAGLGDFRESNLVKANQLFCATWAEVVVGQWADEFLDVLVDPHTGAANGELRITSYLTADVAVGNAAAVGLGQ